MDELTKKTEEITETACETGENVSRETEIAEIEENSAEWSATYVLNESEMSEFIDRSGMITSKRKTVVKGGLAALLCVINAVSYATGGRKMALFLAIVCGVLCGMIFVTPWSTRKALLKQMKTAAEQGNATLISGNGSGLSFGADDDTLFYDYEKVTIQHYGDFVTVTTDDNQMVCVPERAVAGDGWDELCAHAVQN